MTPKDSTESEKEESKKPFVIEPISLEPLADFDFDNIGKLLEDIEDESLKRQTISRRLRGALKMDNPPMTKEEVRDLITEYLLEKYK